MRPILKKDFGLDKDKGELRRYLLVGLSTTIINLAIYHLFVTCGMEYWYANALAIICSKVYAYLANKLQVFRSACHGWREHLWELLRFVMARGFTGIVDYFGLIFAVEALGADKVIAKYAIQMIVIILNYIMGKKLVFRG